MADVIFDHVGKRFDTFVALDDVNLEIHDGEFLVLVGPSGSGKSTALRCLAGLEEITSGKIYIGDRDVTDVPPKDRDIAMVFQAYALYPHMSVRDNLAFGLKLHHTPNDVITQRVTQVAEMLGLTPLLERKPKALSGGQRQRVALGRAIVREPQVFLMDEPLSNLDAKLRVQTRAEIIKLQDRLGTTTVYVTHDQVEAMTMGHRIAVMNAGVIQQLDTPQNLYDRPANMFVATFIGSPAMNVFPANVVKESDGLKLVFEENKLAIPADRASKLDGVIGETVMAGIRPEHLTLKNGVPPAGDTTIQMAVDLVEPLGSETLVHVRAPGGELIVARIDPSNHVRAGDRIDLVVDPARIYFFDMKTEQALN
ncbi:MAG TPA: ABC transporter ATP-binding protein [Nitrolancea sp.]|nr:ABC transporter ATP-binding protein [Nitrolancea sp.]